MKLTWYVAMTLTVGLIVSVWATPKHMVTFNKTYSPGKDSAVAKAKCAVCHVKGKELNLYGKDLQKVMREKGTKDVSVEILKAVENLDSDKDGVANLNELRAGTLPADPKSKP